MAGRINIHIYHLNTEGMAEEMDEENNIVTCQQWILPAGIETVWGKSKADQS